MAKKLIDGRKAGSGRKKGTAKTLAEGRKVGSGRKKGSVSKTLADGRKIGSGRKKNVTVEANELVQFQNTINTVQNSQDHDININNSNPHPNQDPTLQNPTTSKSSQSLTPISKTSQLSINQSPSQLQRIDGVSVPTLDDPNYTTNDKLKLNDIKLLINDFNKGKLANFGNQSLPEAMSTPPSTEPTVVPTHQKAETN